MKSEEIRRRPLINDIINSLRIYYENKNYDPQSLVEELERNDINKNKVIFQDLNKRLRNERKMKELEIEEKKKRELREKERIRREYQQKIENERIKLEKEQERRKKDIEEKERRTREEKERKEREKIQRREKKEKKEREEKEKEKEKIDEEIKNNTSFLFNGEKERQLMKKIEERDVVIQNLNQRLIQLEKNYSNLNEYEIKNNSQNNSIHFLNPIIENDQIFFPLEVIEKIDLKTLFEINSKISPFQSRISISQEKYFLVVSSSVDPLVLEKIKNIISKFFKF